MAYTIYNGVRSLIVDFNGQREEKIENIVSAQFDNAAAGFGSILRSNPYYNYYPLRVTGYTNWSSTDAALYAQLEVLQPGTLSLISLLSMINAGEYIKIYRKGFPNTYIYVIKPSDNLFKGCSVYLYYNGASVGKDFGGVLSSSTGSAKCSIGFLYDESIDKFAMYTINISEPWNSGSHGNAIEELGGIAGSANSAQIAYIQAALEVLLRGNVVPEPPYIDGGTSTTGGGEGSFDDESDEIDLPGIPALNLSLNHFISTYAPTVAQLNALADFMWSDWLSQGPTLAKIFADPSDAIISLHMLPFTPATATAITVTIGSYSTGVSMDPLTLQFYTIDCGELTIDEYWGNYLDYNPYTKLTLFLPYVGEITLNPDEVMGQTIGIKYRVDALTGAFVCFVTRSDKKILGEYQGNCALEVPISSANFAQLHAALLGLAGTAVAAGAAGITGGVSSLLNGPSGAIKSAAGVMDSKVRHSHGGSLGSAAGFMGSQKPYLIIERARQCLPERLNEFAGYPSQVTAKLGDQTGFTSVSDIILDGIPLTDGELTELREILKGGIYV